MYVFHVTKLVLTLCSTLDSIYPSCIISPDRMFGLAQTITWLA